MIVCYYKHDYYFSGHLVAVIVFLKFQTNRYAACALLGTQKHFILLVYNSVIWGLNGNEDVIVGFLGCGAI